MRKLFSVVAVNVFASVYIIFGLILALVMQWAIPAMNTWGVMYYTLTWPFQILHATTGIALFPLVFDFMFTFK